MNTLSYPKTFETIQNILDYKNWNTNFQTENLLKKSFKMSKCDNCKVYGWCLNCADDAQKEAPWRNWSHTVDLWRCDVLQGEQIILYEYCMFHDITKLHFDECLQLIGRVPDPTTGCNKEYMINGSVQYMSQEQAFRFFNERYFKSRNEV